MQVRSKPGGEARIGPKPPPEKERGPWATNLLVGATALGVGQRALSGARLSAAAVRRVRTGAWPEKSGSWALWGFETLMLKSTVDIVPYRGGPANLWGHAFVASQGMKGAASLVAFAAAGPNLWSGLQSDGPAGLVNTTAGRTGVITSIGGVIALQAMVASAARGGPGAIAKFSHAFTDPALGRWRVVAPSMVTFALTIVNETGFMDSLNKGEVRSFGRVQRDAVQGLRHPQQLLDQIL